MKTFRVSVAGGIDAVGDPAVSDGKHVSYMENLDVRSGKAMPYHIPKLDFNIPVGATATQVYSYRGRLLFSEKRRSYASEYVNSRERIYWTEYGGTAQKMIEGDIVPMGINRPAMPPVVNAGNPIAPTNITATVSTGGSLTDGTLVTFRLAYSTSQGILPASGVLQVRISTDNSKITLTWENPSIEIPVKEILLFVGSKGNDERLLTTLGGIVDTYEYSENQTTSGEFASTYDQDVNYTYCTTFLRNVNGVKDESGPSFLTPPMQSSYSRNITIDPWSDGTLDSENLITWAAPTHPAFEIVAGSELIGSQTNPIGVSSIVTDSDSGRVLCTFSEAHAFGDGERIYLDGVADQFDGLPVEVIVEDGMLDTCYLLVGEDYVPPGAGLVGVTAYRVISVGIKSVGYTPETGVVEVVTDGKHTFGTERVYFSGFSDQGWNNKEFDVLPSTIVDSDVNGDPVYRFFIDRVTPPSDTGFTSCLASRSLTAIKIPSSIVGATAPIIGDVLYLDLTTTGTTSATIKTAYAVKAAPLNAYLLNATISGATVAGGPTYSTGISYIPKNDYITHRKLYRGGGTSLFQLVHELQLDELSFFDVLPDSFLGEPIPTIVDVAGITVVVEPPPEGLDGLTTHYNIGFAFEPSSNRLRWTLTGQMDAWPADFYRGFDNRILALKSFNQALCVFCEDGVYRIEGTDPGRLYRHKTKAAPCRAGGSVQFLNNSIIYLSDQGLMEFNGQESRCLTDLRIPGEFWLANSRYLDSTDPDYYLVPFAQNAAFERLRGNDLPDVTPRSLMPYLAQHVNSRGIRSFIRYGKYYLYWGQDIDGYDAQTMVCVDFSVPGAPISVIGIKAIDVFVDEIERVHMLLKVATPPVP